MFDLLHKYSRRVLAYRYLVTMRKFAVIAALVSFVASILFTLFFDLGYLSGVHIPKVMQSYFFAFYISFSFILAWEVLAMIFTIPYSIADSVGKQFEIMSLIIIRYIFEHLDRYSHFISLQNDWKNIVEIAVTAFGALCLFLLTLYYYKIQPHRSISDDPMETRTFVGIKRIISVVLIVILGIYALVEFCKVMYHFFILDFEVVNLSHIFFKDMFTIMIFFDILLIMVTLWYGARYQIVFRTSALAISTILIRLSFSEDIYITILLSLLAAIFAISVSLVYIAFDRIPPYKEAK